MSSKNTSTRTWKLDEARRRARYRAWHRGTKELDLIMGRFCDEHVMGFDERDLACFEQVMENAETLLQAWLMGQVEIPEGEQGRMLCMIRDFYLQRGRGNESRGNKNHETGESS